MTDGKGTDRSALILTYHAVGGASANGDGGQSGDPFYTVPAETFERQMAYLKAEGFRTLLLEEFLSSEHESSENDVILTFDDGHESNLLAATPILLRNGFRAVFFISLEYLAQPHYLDWGQVREMAATGMSIQSHGLRHRSLARVPGPEVEDSLRAARRCLERHVKQPVRYLAMPFGDYTKETYPAAKKAGFDAVCISDPGVARPGPVLPRVVVRRGTSQREFEELVHRRAIRMSLIAARNLVVAGFKNMIGEERYRALKEKILE